MNEVEKEKLRIEREQLRNFKDKRVQSIEKLHNRLIKVKKIKKREEMR